MDETLIKNHNEVVSKNDVVVHGGDFTLIPNKEIVYKKYINRLNGNHIFILGSHDRWLRGINALQIWEKRIENVYLVVSHYCLRVWSRSHYNSYHLFGHSHGTLEPIGKSMDIGVDNNNYYPISFEQIKEIMKTRPDNPNLIKK